MSNFNGISSIDSKFDTQNKLYNNFKKSKEVNSQNDNTKQRKITVLQNASLLYDQLVDIYKKEYHQVFKSKDIDWKLKHDYKNLKDLDYQPNQPDQPQQPDQSIPKWVKATKSRINETKSRIAENKKNELKTTINKK